MTGQGELQVDTTGGGVSAADVAAFEQLRGYQATRLTGAHARAGNWTAGLTAAAGVVGTATVVKGPATFADLPDPYRWFVLASAVVAALGLLVGIYATYQAAYGEDARVAALALGTQKPRPADQLAIDLATAVGEDITQVRQHMRRARTAVVIAVVAILVATLTSWLPEEAQTTICTQAGTHAKTETSSTSEPDKGSMTTTTITCVR